MTIDNIDKTIDLEGTVDSVATFHSDNDTILQIGNTSAFDVNENMNNVEGISVSSEDVSLPSQLCEILNDETDSLCPYPNIDCILEPRNEGEINNNLDKMRQYLQIQCYEGSKWYHSLTFEGTTDKKNSLI